jgi:hypothetical protein
MIHYSTIASPYFRSTPGYETLIRVVGEETLTYASSHAISQQLEAYIHLMISMDPEYKVCCTANIAGNARDSESNVETIFPHTWYEHETKSEALFRGNLHNYAYEFRARFAYTRFRVLIIFQTPITTACQHISGELS